MSVSVTQTLTIMSSPPLASRTTPRQSAFSPPMSPSSVFSASSSPSTPVRSLSTLHSPPIPAYPLPKSLKRQRPEPLHQPVHSLTSAAAHSPHNSATLPASFSASSASIFALSDLHSPTRPTSVKRSKPSSAVSLASPSSTSSSHSDHSPMSPFSTSSPVSPSSTSSVTGFSSFHPHHPITTTTTTTSATTSPTSPTATAATSLPPLLTLSIPNRTSWFSLHSVDAIEKRALPEFFIKRNPPPTVTQANTRTPLPLIHPHRTTTHLTHSLLPPPSLSTAVGAASYLRYRNTLLLTSALQPTVYLSPTHSRRLLGGVNAASVLRLHAFLEWWGLINAVHVSGVVAGGGQQMGRRGVVGGGGSGGGEEGGVSDGLVDELSSVGGGTGGRARRRVHVRRDGAVLDSMESYVDKTFEEGLDEEESGVMHDMSLPIAAMGIAV